jgi:hypothetical protein
LLLSYYLLVIILLAGSNLVFQEFGTFGRLHFSIILFTNRTKKYVF